ncbi:uncharacterized protein BO95DRAFT_467178 [Aspergillus brunneoviolaceus CBS 621.78]|uniref:Uncharacterized protein n=1 Tax=Aspergillus brunneoviolaceus CBS 621.78 TaxID=1450534 RepID=A0ACD1FYR1_9EURO|nr:hypothetical protein BO95DRAFT_467178 [Aspergillus brunneoviolaceus CBS 621.78]RAH42147.1 hypothetical protein BO95DRAFT_467178 [Aspergillus brunneoviolaceus CBS 621.78]
MFGAENSNAEDDDDDIKDDDDDGASADDEIGIISSANLRNSCFPGLPSPSALPL